MSNTKKGFIVYFDLEEQTKDFTDEQRGKLFRAMFAYASRGEEIEIDDPGVKLAFGFLKVTLREDAKRYEEKCRKNAENGAKGGRPKSSP